MAKAVNLEKINNRKDKSDRGALFIPACLFLGMGWGFVVDKLVGGLFLGLGIGFLLFALTNLFKKKS